MREFIDKILANNYDETFRPYIDFIVTYGTHYFSIGRFGGKIRIAIEVDTKLSEQMTSDRIEFNMKVQLNVFMIRLGIDLGFEYDRETVDEQFEKHTSQK
jgi:hypothetical protein